MQKLAFQIIFALAIIVFCLVIIGIFLLIVKVLLLFNPDITILKLKILPANVPLPGCY